MIVESKQSEDRVIVVEPRANMFSHKVDSGVCEQIEADIKRHVDEVRGVEIKSETIYCVGDYEYDSLYEALVDNVEPYYNPLIEAKGKEREDLCFSNNKASTFQEAVEFAYNCPYEYTLLSGDLTDQQTEFLLKVVEWRLKDNIEM